MRSVIYYFSGTGNSLAVAKKISALLEPNTEILSIAHHINDIKVQTDAELVGFIFPVYMGDAPWVVKEFVKKMHFEFTPYIYVAATCNNNPRKCLPIFRELLHACSQKMAFSEIIVMPGSGKITSPQVNTERLSKYAEKCRIIAQKVNTRAVDINSLHVDLSVKKILGSPRKKLNITFTRFKVCDACNGCGTCKRICPMENVTLHKQKPTWGNRCAACLACFHWCPQHAITFRLPLLGNRPRYHHPDINVKDIAAQQPSS